MERPPRLLVVDDGPESHELVDLLFGQTNVLHARDGQRGWDLLVDNPDLDAIVLDLVMPVLDGFSFLEKLREDRRHHLIPVCVFTANKTDATRALGLGARDFIDKRADYQELRLRILNLVDSKRRAEEANRAKTDFLSVVSHELRTPMSGIVGMVDALNDGALSPDQQRYVEVLDQSARKLMELVDDVLHFLDSENPLHSLPRSAFSPRIVVKSVATQLETDALRNECRVDVHISSDVPETLIGLPDKVALVLKHLVANAIKFAPGGQVVILVEPAAGGLLDFVVRDTGVGFPEGWKERIFHPFTQLDGSDTRRFGGLGLGLSVAGRMVQMLGGHLEAKSEPGRGSQFHFTLAFPN